jgi:hypothetical protein
MNWIKKSISNILNGIQISLNWIHIQLHLYSIEEKWDANWCRRYWKSTHDYVVELKKPLKKHKSEKRRLSIPFYLGINH